MIATQGLYEDQCGIPQGDLCIDEGWWRPNQKVQLLGIVVIYKYIFTLYNKLEVTARFGQKKEIMLFLLILGYVWCSVVTSVAFSSNLINFEKNPKENTNKSKNILRKKKKKIIIIIIIEEEKNLKNTKYINKKIQKIHKNPNKLENVENM